MSTKGLFKQRSNEAGMVAIMVTMVLMIVISLIVLGFAQISRRNQRQSLDRQLSTQAFYAAETGVNDASKIIKTAVAGGTTVTTKPNCASNGGGLYTPLATSASIDTTANVAYTCVTVDPAPTSLVYGEVGPSQATIAPLISSGGNINTLTLTWKKKQDQTTPVTTCPNTLATMPTSAAWACPYGMIRFDLVPTGGALTYSSLQNNAMSAFVLPLRPGSGAGTANPIAFTTGGGNNRLGVVCDTGSCSLTINVGALAQSQFYLRASSYYKIVSFEVTGTNTTGGAINFQGAQAIIDSTGKAQDVLRRIQVRVPLTGSSKNELSDFAIQSTDAICKRFSVMEGYFASDANNAVAGVGPAHSTNPLCQ